MVFYSHGYRMKSISLQILSPRLPTGGGCGVPTAPPGRVTIETTVGTVEDRGRPLTFKGKQQHYYPIQNYEQEPAQKHTHKRSGYT